MRVRAAGKLVLLVSLALALLGANSASNSEGGAGSASSAQEHAAHAAQDQQAPSPGAGTTYAVLIDDFDTYRSGSFPESWSFMSGTSIKDAREAVRRNVPASVIEEEGNHFLQISEHDDAHTVLLRLQWDLRQHPCVRWRWRVTEFPQGANERVDGSKDTAASLYVIFKIKKFLGITKGMVAIRYLWSNELPVGDWMKRRGSERLVVVQSGTQTGEWRQQTINVLASYAALYPGDKLPKNAMAIALRTDANSTGTVAVAQYDDLEMLTECPAQDETAAPSGPAVPQDS